MKVHSLLIFCSHSLLIVAQPRVSRRADSPKFISLPLQNDDLSYVAGISVGSNRQPMKVHFDTSTGESWVMSRTTQCSPMEKRDDDDFDADDLEDFLSPGEDEPFDDYFATACLDYGSFSTDLSKSWKDDTEDSLMVIGTDQREISANRGTDDVAFADIKVKDFEFGVALSTTEREGAFGLGFLDEGSTHESLPQRLKSQGLINKSIYSLYLDSPDATFGSIMFGAVDRAKYEGQISVFDSVTRDNQTNRLGVQVTSVSVGSKKSDVATSNFTNQIAFIDTASSLSFIPGYQFDILADAAGFKSSAIGPTAPCGIKNVYLNYRIGDIVIRAPVEDLLVPALEGDECYLSVVPTSDDLTPMTLGLNVLRYAYLVVDVDERKIGLAPAIFTSKEQVEVITEAIPTTASSNNTVIESSAPSQDNENNEEEESGTSSRYVSLTVVMLSSMVLVSTIF